MIDFDASADRSRERQRKFQPLQSPVQLASEPEEDGGCHSQQIEPVGRLAGVVHNLNNMLGVITICVDRLVQNLPPTDELKENSEEIRKAIDSAVSLTNGLLSFGGEPVRTLGPLNLNAVIADLETMLKVIVGEDIELVFAHGRDLAPIQADSAQIGQILINLAVNARDAMPRGGKLSIETDGFELGEHDAHHRSGVAPGSYVKLMVSDTGIGMDEATLSRIFEPFFTTKSTGTGLGLSTVYGTVKQSGGHISVRSEPGQGTSFKIYLPIAVSETDMSDGRRGVPQISGRI